MCFCIFLFGQYLAQTSHKQFCLNLGVRDQQLDHLSDKVDLKGELLNPKVSEIGNLKYVFGVFKLIQILNIELLCSGIKLFALFEK